MNIIIAGCGKVGTTLGEQLVRERHEVTFIDTAPELLKKVMGMIDVQVIEGNCTVYSTLKEAGIEHADLFIAVTDSDEINLLSCLIAKKAGGCQTIARVRNPVYHHEIHHIKDELGLSMVINPEWAAAMEMARLLRFPSAIDIDTFANGRIELLRFQLDDKNPLCGHKIRDVKMRSAGLHRRAWKRSTDSKWRVCAGKWRYDFCGGFTTECQPFFQNHRY